MRLGRAEGEQTATHDFGTCSLTLLQSRSTALSNEMGSRKSCLKVILSTSEIEHLAQNVRLDPPLLDPLSHVAHLAPVAAVASKRDQIRDLDHSCE